MREGEPFKSVVRISHFVSREEEKRKCFGPWLYDLRTPFHSVPPYQFLMALRGTLHDENGLRRSLPVSSVAARSYRALFPYTMGP